MRRSGEATAQIQMDRLPHPPPSDQAHWTCSQVILGPQVFQPMGSFPHGSKGKGSSQSEEELERASVGTDRFAKALSTVESRKSRGTPLLLWRLLQHFCDLGASRPDLLIVQFQA